MLIIVYVDKDVDALTAIFLDIFSRVNDRDEPAPS